MYILHEIKHEYRTSAILRYEGRMKEHHDMQIR